MKVRSHALGRKGASLAAFESYERQRRRRVARIAAQARSNEAGQHAKVGRLGLWLRDRMLSLLMPRFGERAFEETHGLRLVWAD